VIPAVEAEALVTASVALPFLGALLIPLFSKRPNLREGVTLAAATALFLAVLRLVAALAAGARPEAVWVEVGPFLSLAFSVEPLGAVFALIASGLWIVNSIYSIGYMRAHQEPRQTSFYVCFAIALGSTIAIAFAKNLFTMFLFYEALTLSTYPLVTHRRDPEAMRAGRVYLGILLGTSMLLFLPAIVAVWAIAGTLDFTSGGVLGGRIGPLSTGLLLALFVFGIGKAAMIPVHGWLPAAMVAPTPVSALLHAVAVVKAGVFCIVKVVVYIFGLEALAAGGASHWLIYAASASLILASLIALTRDNLKARLAYSTVSQLAYLVLGAALANSAGIVGSGLQLATHAAGKITLFFCAGAIYIAHNKTEVSQLAGIGRRMPVTMTAFLIGSLSIVGLPPFGGLWSKWSLISGALDAGNLFAAAVLVVSSLLSLGYLLPVVARAFFLPDPETLEPRERSGIAEAPAACLIALCSTALLCIVLFFQAGRLEGLLEALFAPAVAEIR
jgi:multicomponent Na+:H+ antiporter subunit D